MKKNFLRWFSIGFAVVFFLISVMLFTRIRSLQEELDTEKAKNSIVQTEPTNAPNDLERKAQATQLLALAQQAYYEKNTRDFQGYMATLEGYADALSEDTLKIYEQLENALRGKLQ